MLPLRERIFPDVDVDIDSDRMRIRTVIRKKHDNGRYYLTEVTRSVGEGFSPRGLHKMLNEFNSMVYGFLMFAPINPEAKTTHGGQIYVEDPDQIDDLQRVFGLYS